MGGKGDGVGDGSGVSVLLEMGNPDAVWHANDKVRMRRIKTIGDMLFLFTNGLLGNS